uniref:Uncharacterized protein n=1 Tax=Globodera rostochiensis TaxID=31243 RepID=A0A914HX50_GLORO
MSSLNLHVVRVKYDGKSRAIANLACIHQQQDNHTIFHPKRPATNWCKICRRFFRQIIYGSFALRTCESTENAVLDRSNQMDKSVQFCRGI